MNFYLEPPRSQGESTRKNLQTVRAAAIGLRFVWELPQNVLGILIWLFVRKRILSHEVIRGRILFRVPDFGVSLGSFIFWSAADRAALSDPSVRPDNREHEFGHSVQSGLLGPLYLIAVGIPSICRFIYDRRHKRRLGTHWKQYFAGFPENWADRLGERNPLPDLQPEKYPAGLASGRGSCGRPDVRKGGAA
jgi:hypothetical protein